MADNGTAAHAPRSIKMKFSCACGTEFPADIYQAVNVTLEPQLLYRLLAGALNVATCPNCGRTAAAAQPFVYHDIARGLFAYVLPRADVSTEERNAILNRLRKVYSQAVEESERLLQNAPPGDEAPRPTVRRRSPLDDLQERIEPEAPPMQVIFGVEQLVTLVDSLLEPSEKLGRVALSTRSSDQSERAQLARIAARMAEQMQCECQVDDEPDEYTVWIYGPRARTNVIARELHRPA